MLQLLILYATELAVVRASNIRICSGIMVHKSKGDACRAGPEDFGDEVQPAEQEVNAQAAAAQLAEARRTRHNKHQSRYRALSKVRLGHQMWKWNCTVLPA